MVMDSPRLSDSERRSRRQRRSRSSSIDSDEELRRRRRRKEREYNEGDRDHKRPYRDRDTKDKNDEQVRTRRRPASPRRDSRRGGQRNDDSSRKRRSSHEDRDRPHKSSKGNDDRPSNEVAVPRGMRAGGPLPSQDASFKSTKGETAPAGEAPAKQKPNFSRTGTLAKETNSVMQADGRSIVLKYHEPAEARKSSAKDVWKLFVFKESEILDTIDLSQRSCWLIGRETAVVDMLAEHPSISKQHAVIQFRYVEKRNEYGEKTGKVKPYLIDLDSANTTSINKEEVPPSRYLELRDKDMIQFGHSTREYVLMLSPKD